MSTARTSKSAKSNMPSEGKKGKKQKKEKILIIDDELDFMEACRRTLEAKSYRITTASSREQAQNIIGTVEPDLVVLGTLAPAGRAFSMYQWLVQHPRYKDIPLLVIDARYEERPVAMGFCGQGTPGGGNKQRDPADAAGCACGNSPRILTGDERYAW